MFFNGIIVVVLLMFLCRVISNCSMVTKKIIGKKNISKIQKLYSFGKIKHQCTKEYKGYKTIIMKKKQKEYGA